MKDTFYFSHDNNAFNDPKIRLLVNEFGIWSYGAFWLIIELISQQHGFKLLLKDFDKVLFVMVQGKRLTYKDNVYFDGNHALDDTEAGRHDIPPDACNKLITKCVDFGLLSTDDKYIWSDSFNTRMQHRKDISVKRSIAGKIGMSTRWGDDVGITNVKQKIITDNKGKDRKGKDIYTNTFQSVWTRYPRKIGSKRAFKHFQATVKTDQDLININKALDNYLACEEVKKGMVKYGSTWFNEWQDWVDYQPLQAKAEGSWGR